MQEINARAPSNPLHISCGEVTGHQSAPDRAAWALLAGLRFFLATVVVTSHLAMYHVSYDWTAFGLSLNGLSAVYGFLFISGFSIAASLEREPDGYLRRRTLRIMPLYFASIAFSVAVSFACGGAMRFANGDVIKAPTPVNVLATALMLQGIVALGLPSDGQVWSLAVEWWCYMAAPFLRRYKLIMAVFAIGSFVYFLQLDANYASSLHARSLLGLSWMWIAGFLFFSMRRKGAGILMLIVPPLIAYLHGTFTGAPLFLTLGLLIVSDAVSFQKSTRAILNWLGDISYPIYLFHFAGIMALTSLGIRNNTLDFLACVVLAIALFYIIDYPIRLIKSKGRCPNLAQPTLNPLTSVPSADDVSLELTSDKAA